MNRARRITQARLDELSAVHPPADWREMFTADTELPDSDVAELDAYFHKFVRNNGKCINCGLVQGGLISALLGGFVYGIQYGEGQCSGCGYPARANHHDVGPIKRWNAILQYHPSQLKTKAEGGTP